MTKSSAINQEILEAALQGLEAQMAKLESQIAQVNALLKRKPAKAPTSATPTSPAPVKRVMSAEARKRIAAAQKKRWAAYHKSRT